MIAGRSRSRIFRPNLTQAGARSQARPARHPQSGHRPLAPPIKDSGRDLDGYRHLDLLRHVGVEVLSNLWRLN